MRSMRRQGQAGRPEAASRVDVEVRRGAEPGGWSTRRGLRTEPESGADGGATAGRPVEAHRGAPGASTGETFARHRQCRVSSSRDQKDDLARQTAMLAAQAVQVGHRAIRREAEVGSRDRRKRDGCCRIPTLRSWSWSAGTGSRDERRTDGGGAVCVGSSSGGAR